MTPTILIIDDSPEIHSLVSSCVIDEPWHVLSAFSGSEGIQMASSRGAELVLLDVSLPDMNGFDVCRHLQAEPNVANASIVFLTSSATVDEKVCGLRIGACDYITKPFDPSELIERIRKALRVKRLNELTKDFGLTTSVKSIGTHPKSGAKAFQNRKLRSASRIPQAAGATTRSPLFGVHQENWQSG